MFSGARYLIPAILLGIPVGPNAVVVAQSGTQGQTGAGLPQTAAGVTWLLPGTGAYPDSLMSICEPPTQPKKVVRPYRKPTAPKLALTPGIPAKPKVRKKVSTVPGTPRMLCPQVQLGPTMMGTLDPDESVIPFPGDIPTVFEQMALVTPREVPLNLTPVVAAEGRRRLPLAWLLGAGAGVGLFTQFTGDDPRNPGGPRFPGPPRPPTIENPDIPLPPVTTTPEPGTLILVGTGLAGVAGALKRRRKQQDTDSDVTPM